MQKVYITPNISSVEQSGEFLDIPLRQLPHSRVTVALIYNLKREALEEQNNSGSAPLTTGLPSSASRQVNSVVSPFPNDGEIHENDLYAEWDTMETIGAVQAALASKYEVLMVEANEAAVQKLLENRPDFAFNMSEGLYGVSREAQIPSILEMLRIPYLGSDPLTLATCLDKARTKEVLCYHKIPTAPFSVIRSMEDFEEARVKFPAMVKPLHEGSSKGIRNSCVVRSPEELEKEVRLVLTKYGEPALVEEFLPGREFTVAMLGNGADLRVLPIVEIRFDALPSGVNPIYSYEAKWIWDSSDKPLEIFDCPANLEDSLRKEIEKICRDTYRVLQCRDWARIDLRLDGRGKPCVMEVNPLPGILPKPEDNSCFPKAARAAGMSYEDLILTVLQKAFDRTGLRVPGVRQPAPSVA
jgi:D-alanine-D-alanine ligase